MTARFHVITSRDTVLHSAHTAYTAHLASHDPLPAARKERYLQGLPYPALEARGLNLDEQPWK